MALKQFGDTNYKFGLNDPDALAIAAILGLTPQEATFSEEPEVQAEGKDINSRTVSFVIDDSGKKTVSMNGYVSNAALFAASKGKTFTFSGSVYIVTNAERSMKSTEFTMGTVSAISFPKITSGGSSTVAA